MHDCEYQDAVIDNLIMNAEGKTPKHRSADPPMKNGIRFRIFPDKIQSPLDFSQKLLSQPLPL